MRVPSPIQEFFAWRWAPCVALTAGSIAFVGLAVLLIPSQFDAARSAESVSVFDRPVSGSRAIYSASLAQGASLAQNAITQGAPEAVQQPRLRAQPIMAAAPQVRGFSPVMERAEPSPPSPEAAPPPLTPPAPPVPVDAVPAPPPPPSPPEADAPRREN